MTGYPKEEALDLLADLRKTVRGAVTSTKLVTVLRMINDLELELVNNEVSIPVSFDPDPIGPVKQGKRHCSNPPSLNPVGQVVGDYRQEDEWVSLPNPNYELGN